MTQVENTSVPSGLSVHVKKMNLPASFDQLILNVLSTVGAPVSYTRTSSPSRITITVPNKISKFMYF